MKLYTRSGDDGMTGLFGGPRVPKTAPRVVAYGTVDELNSTLGLAAAGSDQPRINEALQEIQSRLFDLGADLATPPDSSFADQVPGVPPEAVEKLEKWIDAASEPVPEQQQFVLPGGSELAARLHVARTVCRRAERAVTALHEQEPVGEPARVYLNRLGDLLFAFARWANHLDGIPDVPWRSGR